MSCVEITPEALDAIKSFNLPEDLTFGSVLAPVMVVCRYEKGAWQKPKLLPYQKIELDPTCKVLHYAQEIFEGMKAYREGGKGPYLFRPEENMDRFNFSARRMAMPEVPEHVFMDSVKIMTAYNAHFVPTNSGDSLYIRPFMFATDNNLGIKPSESFSFMVVASPSSAYFSTGTIDVVVERESVRACPGGVGNAKTGGNYAASLLSMIEAKKKGFDQVLWLDAVEKRFIEELSGMNFFAIYGDTIVTPEITPTILDGITRKSILKLAKHLGHKVQEKRLAIRQVLEDIKEGKCTECFACGTAVIITPIAALGESDGTKYEIPTPQDSIALKIRKALLDIQEGNSEDPFKWRIPVEPAPL